MPSVIAVVLLAAPLPFCEGIPPVGRERPLSDQVRLTLATDQTSYFVGEPITLKGTFENVGNVVAHVYAGSVVKCVLDIYYAKVGTREAKYKFPYARLLSLRSMREVGPDSLRPGQSRDVVSLIAVDGATDRFVIPEPGEYDFKLEYRDSFGDTPGFVVGSDAAFVEATDGKLNVTSHAPQHDPKNGRLISNVLRIHVLTPPKGEQAAAAAYLRKGLGLIAQSRMSSYQYPIAEEDIEAAADLTERHPDSVYARHLRRGLQAELRNRMSKRGVPKDRLEKQMNLYEKIRAQEQSERR